MVATFLKYRSSVSARTEPEIQLSQRNFTVIHIRSLRGNGLSYKATKRRPVLFVNFIQHNKSLAYIVGFLLHKFKKYQFTTTKVG